MVSSRRALAGGWTSGGRPAARRMSLRDRGSAVLCRAWPGSGCLPLRRFGYVAVGTVSGHPVNHQPGAGRSSLTAGMSHGPDTSRIRNLLADTQRTQRGRQLGRRGRRAQGGEDFLYIHIKGTPCGRARQPASAVGSEHRRGSTEKERVNEREARRRGEGGRGPLTASGRQPGAAPQARSAHRRAPLPLRGQPRTRLPMVPAVRHPR